MTVGLKGLYDPRPIISAGSELKMSKKIPKMSKDQNLLGRWACPKFFEIEELQKVVSKAASSIGEKQSCPQIVHTRLYRHQFGRLIAV